MLRVPIAFALVLSLAPVARADDAPAAVDRVFAGWDRSGSPGCAVVVLHGGKVVLQKGYGTADLDHNIPITPTTAFNIGSVSKQFTALAILLLARDGKLALDDEVRKHVPQVPDFGTPITIRHLIHHTSGLREDWSLLAMTGTRSEDVIRTRDILRLVSRQKELNFTPGAEHLYCNTGYDLLAEIISRVSGTSFSRFAKKRIFEPAGMKASVFCDDHRLVIANRAESYRSRAFSVRFERVHFATERAGPSNLFTTAEDMGRWLAYLDRLDREEPDLAAAMQQTGKLNSGKPLTYAAGWRIGTHRGARTVAHGGSTAGYRATLVRYPEHRFAVALLGNLAGLKPDDLAREVADLYLDSKLEPKDDKPGPNREPSVKVEPIQRAEEELAGYAGSYYSDELEFLYRVVLRGGRLVVLHPNSDIRLRPIGEDRFDTVGNDERVFDTLSFTRSKEGTVTGLKVSTARARNVRFARVDLKPVR